MLRQAQLAEGDQAMFVNFSNHSSSQWSEKQIKAAQALGKSEEIEDIAFPEVDPYASSEDIEVLALACVEKILKHAPRACHVAGEPTLACYVVALLQSNGIDCYAATTKRIAEERVENGVTTKVSRFEFCQFRKYLMLSF